MNSESTILITGGTGFVGSHLVEELQAQGFTQVYVTNYSPRAGYVGELLPADKILQLDLTNREATANLIDQLKPAYVFHLASIAVVGDSFDKAAQIFQNNISLQLNLLDAVKQYSPSTRILVVGSGAEYGMVESSESGISEDFPLRPINPYSVSKVTQDLLGLSYFFSYKLDIVRVRPFNHIGERQTQDFAVPAFVSQIVEIERGQKDKLTVGNLEAVRDFSDVKDVVKAYILLMQKGESGEVYNVGSGRGYSIRAMLDMMIELATVPIQVQVDPQKVRPLDVPVAIADYKKMKALGWMPQIEIRDTLKRIMEEWRNK